MFLTVNFISLALDFVIIFSIKLREFVVIIIKLRVLVACLKLTD